MRFTTGCWLLCLLCALVALFDGTASGATAITEFTIPTPASQPIAFTYQTTDPNTNALTGTPNTPATIAANGFQTFVFSMLPTGPFAPADCGSTSRARVSDRCRSSWASTLCCSPRRARRFPISWRSAPRQRRTASFIS